MDWDSLFLSPDSPRDFSQKGNFFLFSDIISSTPHHLLSSLCLFSFFSITFSLCNLFLMFFFLLFAVYGQPWFSHRIQCGIFVFLALYMCGFITLYSIKRCWVCWVAHLMVYKINMLKSVRNLLYNFELIG